MLLPDFKIKEYILNGKIVVDPFDEKMVGPGSLDIRLGYTFRVFKNLDTEALDVRNCEEETLFRTETKNYVIHHGKYSDLYILKSDKIPILIHPGEFILASIYEYVKLPNNIAAQIHGRSSIARLGLLIHTSAGWVDPGFAGHLTLEIINVNRIPIKLYPLTKIAQLTFYEVEPVEIPYDKRKSSKYVNEDGATFSRISWDFKV